MATSLFFISSTDHNNNTSLSNPNDHLPSNTDLIPTEPHKTRGRKPGSKSAPQQNQKKPKRRGMGVAQLERIRIQAEQKLTPLHPNPNPNPNPIPNPNPLPDPLLVLQGFPSYGVQKVNGGCRRYYYGGTGGGSVGPGQLIIDPVCSQDQHQHTTTKWGFVETSSELSSIPKNPHILNRCDTCFKKKRFDGDVIRSNGACGGSGGGFSKYTMIPPMTNGCYDHLPPVFGQDQRFPGMYYDHRVARSAIAPTGFFNHTTGSMEEYGRENPSNEGGGAGGLHMVKEYEFFPGKYENFPGKYGDNISSEGLVGDCGPNTSFIDLSLKL